MIKNKMALFLAAAMTAGLLAGCESGKEKKQGTDGKQMTELTMSIDSDVTLAGFKEAAKLAEKQIGIKVKVETRPGGSDGDNVVKTRLASGDMADLCAYNSGALLKALNPSQYFLDISKEDFAKKLDETYKSSVSENGAVYGVPFTSTQAGAVIYNKEMYKKYNLQVPKTWDEFLSNCDTLKKNGETAVLGTFADSWTAQVPFLGDNYNLMEADQGFVKELEAGKAKWETTPAALRSFEKMADLTPYFNKDYLATSYDDGCEMMAKGKAGHWFILTQALSNIYELYGEDKVNGLGVFGVPGDDASHNGLTVWMPTSIYGNKNSGKKEAILKFMKFYTSKAALDAYTSAVLPDGPYCIKDYKLPPKAYDAVADDMQSYFDQGKTNVAMEFLTSVKGSDCPAICQELGSGQTTAKEAAKKYDADCAKQARQLGLKW